MPSVPMYNRPQVAPNVRRAVNVPVAATGAGAAALGLSAAAEAFQKERERAGKIRANAAEASIRDISSRINQEVQAMQRTQAFGAEDFVAQKWESEVSKVMAGLSDPVVREAVELRAGVLRQELTERARAHAIRQTEVVEAESYERNQSDDLASLAETPVADADAIIERMALRADQRLTGQGFDPEARASEVANLRSKARLAQVNALVAAEQPDQAMAFLERQDVRDQMRGDDYQRAKKLVEGESLMVRSQRARDELVAEFTTEAEALQAVRNRYAGEMEERVRQQVRQYFGEQEQAKKAAIQSNTDAALRGILAGRGIPAEVRRFLSENDPKVLADLQSYQTNRARGRQPDTNLDVWGELLRMHATNPREFSNLDPRRYRNQLDDRHYEQLLTMQANAMRPQGGRMSPYAVNQFVWTEARRNGLVPQDAATMSDLNRRKEDKERFLLLQSAAQDAVNQLLTDNPRATPADQRATIQAIINNQVLIGGGWFSAPDSIPAAALRRGETPTGVVARRPIAERIAELKAQGVSKEAGLRVLRAEGYTEREINP